MDFPAKWCLCFWISWLGCHNFSSKERASFSFKAAVSVCSDFGAQENKICHCFHFFPFYLPLSDGTRCHDLSFWMLKVVGNFKLFILYWGVADYYVVVSGEQWRDSVSIECWVLSQLFHFPHSLSSSPLYLLPVVSSTYLRLLIFLPAILIPACDSSSPASHMMYSAYKLNT